jgi:hypothetical protein
MANALYDFGRQGFLEGTIDWDTDTIQAILIDAAAYTVNLATHEFLSDIAGGARIGSAVTLASKTVAAGVADAADISFTSLSSAPSIEALVIYKSTGADATSRLIAYIDTATGLPVSAGATQVDVAFDNGANKIFKL